MNDDNEAHEGPGEPSRERPNKTKPATSIELSFQLATITTSLTNTGAKRDAGIEFMFEAVGCAT
jgi:hypothetical protein